MKSLTTATRLCALLTLSVCAAKHAPAQAPAPPSAAINQRAEALLAKMSLDDKLNLIGGVDGFYTQAIPSIGLKRLKMSDGPVGVRTYGPAPAYTASVALAASWDPALAQRVGVSLGMDARARGVNFLLAPGVNIYRSPLNGRNMEYFGEDPFLASRIAVGYINGVQSQGVSATVKHFAANNSEFDRHNINSIVDERTLRELYLPAFEAAVKEAHVGAVMDSYNLINGEHATQNSHLNTEILRNDWGFQGIVMSDWDATYDGVAAANGGLDLEMPFAKLMTAATLKAALAAGKLTVPTLDEKCRRILRTAIQFGWLDRDQVISSIPLNNPAADKVTLDESLESITLLKNDGALLPLDPTRIHTLAIIGPDSATAVVGGGGSSQTTPFKADSFVAGLMGVANGRIKIMYAPGLPPLATIFQRTMFRNLSVAVTGAGEAPTPENTSRGAVHINSWAGAGNAGARGPKLTTYRYQAEFAPTATGAHSLIATAPDQDSFRILIDGVEVLAQSKGAKRSAVRNATIPLTENKPVKLEVIYETNASAPHIGVGFVAPGDMLSADSQTILRNADAVLITAGFDATSEAEGYDRSYELPWPQNQLIQQVAALNPHTIVSVTAGGAVETEPWIAQVPVLLHNWYPGQQGATALAQILLGDSAPEGHLPFSWERTLAQNPASAHYAEEPGGARGVHYAEGLFLGYRYYTSTNEMHETPVFPFGFGMAYTTFTFSHLAVLKHSTDDVEVSFDVTNTGPRAGADVAQVYVGDPSAKAKRPLMELKQFTKVRLAPGASQHVTLHLDRRAFSYYNVPTKSWRLDPGAFTIYVGDSSESIALTQPLSL